VRVSGPLVGAQTFGKKADGAAVERAAIFNVLGRQFPQGNRQIIARSPVLPRLLNCGMEVMRRWDELGEKRLDMISKDTQPVDFQCCRLSVAIFGHIGLKTRMAGVGGRFDIDPYRSTKGDPVGATA